MGRKAQVVQWGFVSTYKEILLPLPGCWIEGVPISYLTLIWKRNHCRNMEDTLRERDIIRNLLLGIFGWCMMLGETRRTGLGVGPLFSIPEVLSIVALTE